ncbi:hypothetical protein SUGI_0574400 [Cryptomeria japonica]|uniref:transcription factor MYB74 n=1 Tax=Cryptomeria japonica TaxID=3369 RepID=UPI002408A0A2|nr:transcription factor MYB74 [Cryptomeria japonica]GLJ29134.1 hypothetical protein SUGI_0574400 [Cryptomeria japonica]
MGRTPCCEKNSGLKKGPWTPDEDQKLIEYIKRHGYGSWRALPKRAGLLRCGKSCRLRWTNYLRPDIKRGRFSYEEEQTIIELHAALGNKWSTIATHLPGRTDNEIKNYWNTHLKKRLMQMGIDPVTHRRRADLLDLSGVPSFYDGSVLNHPQQWENAMLAENLRQALLMADNKAVLAPTDLLSIANDQFNLQRSMSSSTWLQQQQGMGLDYKGLPHNLEQVLQSQTIECASNIKKWEQLLQQSIGYCPSSGINPNGYINHDEYNGSSISDFASPCSMDVLKMKAEQPQMLRNENMFLHNQEDHHNILNVDADLKPKVPFDESNLSATMWADQENPLQLVPPTFCTSNNTIYNQPELIPFMNTSRILFNGE